MKVEVVNNLAVVWFRTAREQEACEFVALWMRRAVFFTFADDTRHRRVVAVAGHEIRVRIGAAIQQQTCNLDGVVVCLWQVKPREAKVGQRFPPLCADILEQVISCA